MHIHLDTASGGVPIYAQLVQQVRYLIAAGRLRPGEEMPPIRALAERLVINPNTVARAYRELEANGLVVKRSTTGTFVADDADSRAASDGLKALTPPADALVAVARKHHVGLDELLEIVRRRYRSTSEENGEAK